MKSEFLTNTEVTISFYPSYILGQCYFTSDKCSTFRMSDFLYIWYKY